nr:PREDICTED: bZIP transcription factor 27-like [Daucus carota subsp. sativus]
MEKIWKDIPDLPSLENPNNHFHGVMNLQESLGRPLVYLTPLLPATNVFFPSSSSSHQSLVSDITCSSQPQLPLAMHCGGGARRRTGCSRENDYQSSSDRRHQRLIRNRESAARSRDRKEARTAELKEEMKRLKAENAELKQKQKVMEEAKALKKPSLNRSASAPF